MISFVFLDSSMGMKKHPVPIGYEDLIVAVVGVTNLTQAKARKCVGALVNFEGGPFRVRMDGGLPVDGVSGYLRSAGDEYFCSREEALRLAVVINATAGGVSGILRVTYYG